MKKFVKSMVCVGMAALFTASFAACTGDDQKPGGGGDNPPVTVDKNPSVVGDAHGYYFAAAPGDLTFNMYMSGGTFESLKVGDTTLTRNQEYKFNIGTEVLTINESYLATLATGDYTFTFSTDQGSCEILVTVGGSDLIEGYNMEFAIPETNDMADHFFAKGARDDEAVTFDFRTFGNFTTEGTSLKFINLLVDNAPFDDTGLNWRLGPEDVNVRLYSDGTVIYRKNFTGTEIKNDVANGLDNIWWRTNWNNPNYQTGDVDDVTVTREGGVTSFSLELSYDFLGIESTDDFRFALMECSDASSYDFNLYERGIVQLDGKALGDPAQLSNWPMFTAENKILRPEEIPVEPVEGVPDGYDLSFATTRGDKFFSKISYAEETGVTFHFWTKGDFNTDGTALEFVQIYLDLPDFNIPYSGVNWRFNAEDVAIRLYSDGSVYFLTEFDGTVDNVWGKLDHDAVTITKTKATLTKSDTPLAITRQDGVTTFSLTVTLEQLGIGAGESLESFRFYLTECSDNSANDFNLYGSDLAYQEKAAGDPARFENYLLFTLATQEVSFPSNVVEPEEPGVTVPEGYDLSFAKASDNMYAKISLAENDAGVTFAFWTKGDFSGTGEFVNIYLDMPAYNNTIANWCFAQEDVNIRVYADGTVYLRTGFDSTKADNVWYPRTELTDSNKLAQKANIVKDEENGTTTVSVTISFEQLVAECVDNDTNFGYFGADLTVNAVAAGADARLESWPMFTAEGEVLLAKDIPVEGLPKGYDLSFAKTKDQIYSKISYAEGTGVTFDFWTKGDFAQDSGALEFVQIYLDMPAFNLDQTGNWQFRQEDVVIRVYSDGNVYFLTDFNGQADNVWCKLDHEALKATRTIAGSVVEVATVTKAASITINRQNGVTTFSLTVTLEQLGIGTGETLDSFRFYIAECSDNSGSDFALYASDLSYKGTAAGDPARFENYLLFTLATGEISADANEAQQ